MIKILIFLLLVACSSHEKPLPTAQSVDVQRYVGKWYAIAAFPQFFTRECKSQTAEYAVIDKQTISVVNTCIKKKGQSSIKGEAVVINTDTNAELEVKFDKFFLKLFNVKGDYTIIKLDPQYRYVLVGSKDRDSLWILSRSKMMPAEEYEAYVSFAQDSDFDTSELKKSEL